MNRMRELRKGINLTMKQMGEMIGCSESTVSFYETGRHEPDLNTVAKIADILGTSIDHLVGHDTEDIILCAEQKEIINLFSKLNDEGRRIALNTMRALSAYPDMTKKEPHTDNHISDAV